MPGRKVFVAAATIAACLLAAPRQAFAKPLFGFFPSPPELTFQSVVETFKAIARHADVVLIQRNIPWKVFAAASGAQAADISDLAGMVELARRNGLGTISTRAGSDSPRKSTRTKTPIRTTTRFSSASIGRVCKDKGHRT